MPREESPALRRNAGATVACEDAMSGGFPSDTKNLDSSQSLLPMSTTGRRKWSGAAIAGAFMFALAAAGLVAIFYAIQGTADSGTGISAATSVKHMLDASGRGPEIVEPDVGGVVAREVTRRSPQMAMREAAAIHAHRPNSPELLRENGIDRDTGRNRDGNGQPGGTADGSASDGSAARNPNIFFIMIDDMGWNDIGYQSNDLSKVTPNLDRLAANGIKMTNYYTMSICTPSRASLMTGRYPVRYGLQYNVIQPGAPWGLALTEKLMPEYLNERGYISHMVGKWHLGSFMHSYLPHRRGFETFFGYLNDEERYWTHQSWTASLNGNTFFDFGFGNQSDYYDIIPRPLTSSSSGDSYAAESSINSPNFKSCATCNTNIAAKYSTSMFTERALEVIQDKTPYDEQPLFLYLAHQAVHDPLGLPSTSSFNDSEWEILDSIRPTDPVRKKFAKVLMYLDKSIGKLVHTLDEKGWLENSIIIVASDNGGCPQNGGSNYPLRGIKHSYWEGGNKVPAFIYSRSHIPEELRGTSYDGMMHVTDWLPTIMGAVNSPTEGSAGRLDGMNHWNYILDNGGMKDASPRSEILYNFDPYILWTDGDSIGVAETPLAQGAFRSGRWKIMFNVWCSGYYNFDETVLTLDPLTDPNSTCQDSGTCSTCGQGCVSDVNYTDWLFDLESDPREQKNVIHLYPELAENLRERAREIAFDEWSNSSYEDINKAAYKVWARHGWWMTPWYHFLFGDDDR